MAAALDIQTRQINVFTSLRVRPRSLSRITKLSQHESDGR
jgi:hypothetical protein